MQKILAPVLLLATVTALSSSNILPIQSMGTQLGFNDQQKDNTFDSKHQTRGNLNAILFNVDVEPEIHKISQFLDPDNNAAEDSIDKNANYNVKGFRKEQWHNYPRQLDRLNKYLYEEHSSDKRNLDPDDPGNDYENDSDESLEKSLDDLTSNELPLETDPETRKINDEAEVAAAVINPLLVFRIHLATLNNRDVNWFPRLEASDLRMYKLNEENKEENSISQELSPESNLIKVKREGKMNSEDVESAQKDSKNRNKRIFSLWSRLQSLNHKGHELHHRRHLYALYGLPDSESGGGGSSGVLTAETRATFMRPPGSPLRWG